MAKQRLKSPRVRLFVALDLPDWLREGVVRWQAQELTDPALRVVEPANLHLTLAFLGYIPEKEVGAVAEIVHRCEAPAPRVQLRPEPVGKPRNRPSFFAFDADSPQTVALQAELESRLASARLHEPEKRPFWPHLTVARVRKERRGSKRPARVERVPGALPEALCEAFRGVRITLYRSILRPQGAEYAPLAQLELPAGQTD
jgi:2'-5' RNA ligase